MRFCWHKRRYQRLRRLRKLRDLRIRLIELESAAMLAPPGCERRRLLTEAFRCRLRVHLLELS